MHIQTKQLSETRIQLTITADADLLAEIKQQVVRRIGQGMKLAGFRMGKVPPALAEKYADPATLQTGFLDVATNKLYADAVAREKLHPVSRPEVSLKKFVPFNELVIEVVMDVLGIVKLPDYSKFKLAKKPVAVTGKDVADVIDALRTRAADKKTVKRSAADGDEVWIDFVGTDAMSGEAIQGADGKAYPLLLGSNTFIPGFETNLVGVEPGATKTFTLTFPKDYGVKALQNRKVTFKTTVTKVNQVIKPKVDDDFAKKAGPFKSLIELKADIAKQLTSERESEAEREQEQALLEKIVEASKVPIPKVLADEEIERMELEERQNLAYRGQTWQEHLAEEGVNDEEHREQKRPQAENRVKAGLVLSEIAEREKITVSPEELEIRMQLLKGQYQDKQMQAELDKPESQREILSRMVTEKTIAKLKMYASAGLRA